MPVVTALRERPRGRVEIELDGAAWRVAPIAAVARAGLHVGAELDRETAVRLGRALRHENALSRAARALSSRERSRAALLNRLSSAGVGRAASVEALGTLERLGLVDDVAAAGRRAEHLAGRGWGDAAIRLHLEHEGFAAEAVEAALRGLEPEPARARALLPAGAGPRELRRLAARGFDAAVLEELGRFADEA